MYNLKLKHIGDHYYVTNGDTKIISSIRTGDFDSEEEASKEYDVDMSSGYVLATIELNEFRDLSTGYTIDFLKKYFEIKEEYHSGETQSDRF